MRILLDESVPVQVRNALGGHVVASVNTLGWKGLENGRLLNEAESHGYDVLIIADKNLRHQQNLTTRRIALVELWTNHRPTLERHFPLIASAVARATPGAYVIVSPP
ncbi:MAG TPA: hypothetical protein VN541_22525 [Tepidisphaeraceae bacterium]|nr:hypothetical protein [Tepidisphaeraceae bacterium]